jgi:hypothetical protein
MQVGAIDPFGFAQGSSQSHRILPDPADVPSPVW